MGAGRRGIDVEALGAFGAAPAAVGALVGEKEFDAAVDSAGNVVRFRRRDRLWRGVVKRCIWEMWQAWIFRRNSSGPKAYRIAANTYIRREHRWCTESDLKTEPANHFQELKLKDFYMLKEIPVMAGNQSRDPYFQACLCLMFNHFH